MSIRVVAALVLALVLIAGVFLARSRSLEGGLASEPLAPQADLVAEVELPAPGVRLERGATAARAPIADPQPTTVAAPARADAPVQALELDTLSGAIEGIVLDAAEQPLAGASVTAACYASRRPDPQAITDAGGRFRLGSLAPGTYRVGCARPGAHVQERVVVRVLAGATARVVLGGAPRTIRVSGRVQGLPAEGQECPLVAVPAGAGQLTDTPLRTRVRAEGRFELDLPAPGAYAFALVLDLRMTPLATVDVPDQRELELQLTLPAGSIAGVLLDEQGAGVRNGRVRVVRDGFVGGFELAVLEDLRTAADGSWTCRGLPPGAYVVHSPRVEATLVEVPAGSSVSGIRLRRTRAGSIAGRVLDTAGRPLQDASVCAFDASGRSHPAKLFVPRPTSAGGAFLLEDLPPGRYRLAAYDRGEASAVSEPLLVEAGTVQRVELHLLAGTLLELTLREPSGTLLPAAWSVRDAFGCNHACASTGPSFERFLEHGLELRTPRFGPLPPGTYRVEALTEEGRKAMAEITLGGEPTQRLELTLLR